MAVAVLTKMAVAREMVSWVVNPSPHACTAFHFLGLVLLALASCCSLPRPWLYQIHLNEREDR